MPLGVLGLVLSFFVGTVGGDQYAWYSGLLAFSRLSVLLTFGFFSEYKYVITMVKEGMDEFVKTHVCCYPESKNVKTHFIGSISKIYEKELNYAADKNGIILGNIIRKPVENLVNHHLRELQLI